MKKYFLIFPVIFFLFFASKSFAQVSKDTADFPYWIEMMQNEKVNFYDVQRAFNKYYAKHYDQGNKEENEESGEAEEEGLAMYKRWEYMMIRRINPDGSRKPGDQIYKEIEKYRQNQASKTINSLQKGAPKAGSNPTGNWSPQGPFIKPTNLVSQPNGMGRVNAIAFDPVKKGTIYIGSAGGGLWVTSDSGTTWTTLTDGLATLGISAIAIDPGNASTIYIGTGDRDNNDAPGLGVMKSTNGGSTWSLSNSGMGNVTVSKIIINPSNTGILLAATSGGIFRSTNGGSTWTGTSANTAFYKDITFKPKHPNVVYAATFGQFWRSSNGGVSFKQITSGLTSAYRGVIGVTPADTNRVYFITTAFDTFSASYISTDGGTTFRVKSNSPNIMDYTDNATGRSGNGWYNLCVSVDTANKGTLYVGGINIFKSTDSGTTWTAVAHWLGGGLPEIHADQHVLAINPLNNKLFVGNDGGLFYSANKGSTWNDISNGLGISEIYKIGQSATRQDLMLAGFQDNGTSQINNSRWSFVIGGDGMECAIDPKDTNYQYGEIYYGSMFISKNGGKDFSNQIAGQGIGNITEAGGWVTPFVISKSNNNAMFGGYNNLWRCLNTKASAPTWTKISSGLSGSSHLAVTEQSVADTGIFYMADDDGGLFLSSNINASAPTWTDLSSGLPYSGPLVVDVKTYPKSPSIVYIIQDQKIYLSTNKGASWTDITGTLPAVAKNSIAIDKNSNYGIYVGTDAGVFYRDSTMTDWIPFYTGLPAAGRVMELEIFYDASNSANNKIKAGTYGRGAWVSDLFSPSLVKADLSINAAGQCLTGNSFNFTDNSTIPSGTISTWSWDFGDLSTTSTSQNPKHTYTKPGTYTVKLIAGSNLGSVGSVSKSVTVYPQSSPSFTVNSGAQCLSGNSFSFTDKSTISSGSISKWGWDFGDLATSASQNISHSYSASGKFKVILTLTSDKSCVDTVSKLITVYPQPVASYNVAATSQCLANNSFSFKDASTVSSGTVTTWKWLFGNGDSSKVQNPTYVYPKAGTYLANLKVTTNNGCTDNITKTITIYSQPVAKYVINITVQCLAGNSYVFTDKSTIASGSISSWAWDFGDGNTAATQNVNYTFSKSGTFQVKLKVTSNNGCVDTLSHPMLVFPQPVVNFGVNNDQQCIASNIFSFSDKTTISSGKLTSWLWSFGDFDSSSIQNPTKIYTVPGTYRVWLQATTANGCVDTFSSLISANPQPLARYTINNTNQCLNGNSFSLVDKSTVSIGKIAKWGWDFGDGNTLSVQSPNYVYNKEGSYNIKLKVATDKGCTDSLTKTIAVYPKPIVSFAVNSNSSCLSANNFKFTDNTSIASGKIVNWFWDFGDSSYSSQQNPVHSYAKPGTYKVILKASSNNACGDTFSKRIIVYPQTSIGFTVDKANQCLKGNSFAFTDKSILTSGKFASWFWRFGDFKTAQVQNPIHIFKTAGIYNTILKTTTDKGCIDSVYDTIRVYPNPKPLITGDSSPCARTNIIYKTNKDSASLYAWKVKGVNIVSGDSTNAITVYGPGFSSGFISVIETNYSGCIDSVINTILVKPRPTAVIRSFSSVCAGKTINFRDSSEGADSYKWNFGDTLSQKSARDTSSAQNPQHTFSAAGKYTIKLYAINAEKCTDSIADSATINPLPDAHWKLNYDQNLSVFHAQDSSLVDTSYHWVFGDGSATVNGHAASHTFPSNKSYNIRLTLVNTNGCVNEYDSSVNISKSPIERFENKQINLTIYPNPFKNNTTIDYSLAQNTRVRMTLFDVSGKEACQLINENQEQGDHKVEIDPGSCRLLPGVYILKVMLNDQVVSKHIVEL